MLTLGGNTSPRGRRARACGSRRGCRTAAFIVVASVCVFGIGHRPCSACLVLLWLYVTSGFSFGGLACLLRIGTGWVGVCYTGFRFLDRRCRKALGVVSLSLPSYFCSGNGWRWPFHAPFFSGKH